MITRYKLDNVYLIILYSLFHYISRVNPKTCITQPINYVHVQKHLATQSNLYFLFGLNIHRPFINEYNQRYADATVFIIVTCNVSSSDCIAKGGSLPSNYRLEFTIDDVAYDDKDSRIDRSWHRIKLTNYDILYQPFNSHSWYDEAENENGSIWKNFIMNFHSSNQYENVYSKWTEFEIKLEDAGIQFIEGQQIYNGSIVQQFSLNFYVPTFECLDPPLVFFDSFISNKIYLSSFHFQSTTDSCRLRRYACSSNSYKEIIDDYNVGTLLTLHNSSFNITINPPSLLTQRISFEQNVRSTNWIDYIFDELYDENNSSFETRKYYREAICISENSLTSRKYHICTQNERKSQALIKQFQIHIIMCFSVDLNIFPCTFLPYQDISGDSSRLLLAVQHEHIQYIGFMCFPENSSADEWLNQVYENYYEIQATELINKYDHTIELNASNCTNTYSITRSYQIITDQTRVCHLLCRNNCIQQLPNSNDYYVSQSKITLLLFCVHCDFNEIFSLFVKAHSHSRTILSANIVLIHFEITEHFQQILLKCLTFQNQLLILNTNFYFIRSNQSFPCSVSSTEIYPYHEEIVIECEYFITSQDIVLFVITQLNNENIRILLSPSYVTYDIIRKKYRMIINGIPHGDNVVLELKFLSLNITESYKLKTMDLDDNTIIKINTNLARNYFSSAFELLNNYLKIYENGQYIKLNYIDDTSFLFNVIHYYHLILTYIDQESLHTKAIDFSQRIFSHISLHLFKYKVFYPYWGNIYLNEYISLLIKLSSYPKLITYETYHLLRHIIGSIDYSLPDNSVAFLRNLFHLCVNIHSFIVDPKSLPIPIITDSFSLFKLNQINSRLLMTIYFQLKSNTYSNYRIERIDNGSLDFIFNMSQPFTTRRWSILLYEKRFPLHRYRTNLTKNSFRSKTETIDVLYYPQEYIPIYVRRDAKSSIDYILGQLLSIKYSNNILHNSSLFISYSLEQIYLNTSNILETYFANIVLIRIKKNHYSHRFSFGISTTKLARNISLLFFNLPNSENYVFTIDIAYNDSCVKSKIIGGNVLKYNITVDLWERDHFVYSIPIEPMSIVCSNIEIESKQVFVEYVKRTGKFLVIESGCYSFNENIYDDYYSQLKSDECQLINENQTIIDNLLAHVHLTCDCQNLQKNSFLLCQPKSLIVEFELHAQTWLYFYIYLSILLLSFLLLGLYCIYKDTFDDYKPYIHFLPDNQVAAINSYVYQLTVFTGLQQSTSKNFHIYIRLIGNKCQDISHCLNYNLSHVFQRGSVDQFLLTSFIDIGEIVAINIWHQKIDMKADFYIRHCILYDYYRQRTYYFCCYTWLSLRIGLNTINEIFYVAQQVDQYAFGHLFLSTYSWLYYHYHLFNSIFNKQKQNTLSRLYRLNMYYSLIFIQLYFIQFIVISCRTIIRTKTCLNILPSFLSLVDQSFVASGWMTIYHIIRLNLFSSIILALTISLLTAIVTPILIFCLTLLTDKIELYKQLLNSIEIYENIDSLHSTMYSLASTIADYHSYKHDIDQFQYNHKFDLQHRLSTSTLGENEQKLSQSDSQINQNNNSSNNQESKSLSNLNLKMISQKNQQLKSQTKSTYKSNSPMPVKSNVSTTMTRTETSDDVSLSTRSSASSFNEFNISVPTIKLKVNWKTKFHHPTTNMYRSYLTIYYITIIILVLISVTSMYITMKTFIEVENYFLTLTIIFIHILVIMLTLIFEIIAIFTLSLLNATFFHITDENEFILPVIQIPIVSTIDIEQSELNPTFGLHRNVTLDDVQLRERIRERFLESSVIRAIRDVIGYILFMTIIIIVYADTSANIETRSIMRQYTFKLLFRENIFQNIEHIPDTMDWISYLIENRLFLEDEQYQCQKDTCNYAHIPDSPLYLTKSIRIRQIRVNRKECHTKINEAFSPSVLPNCFIGGKKLLNERAYVINSQQECSGWNIRSSNETCKDVCNYASVWSAIAYTKMRKVYNTYESPWYFMFYLLPKETIERCNRKRKYYDLKKNQWLDEKTLVVIIEGNLYSPETASMISFVLTIERNPYGSVVNDIFIEVSEYSLAIINDRIDASEADKYSEQGFIITHYLFGALVFVIFTTKLFGIAKFTRSFGFSGLIFFLRTLSNQIDGILIILCGYYFVFYYFEHNIFQLNSLLQSINIYKLFLSFRVLIVNDQILNHLIGFICLVAIFKFLYLLKFNPKTYLLTETIYQSGHGFFLILCVALSNYFIFTLMGHLLFSSERNFKTFFVAFRRILTSSIKNPAPIENQLSVTLLRGLWQVFLWLFSAKIIEYFLISFVTQIFAHIRKTHQLTDEERIVGRLFQTLWTYFAFNKKSQK